MRSLLVVPLFFLVFSLSSFSMEEIKDDKLLGNDTVNRDVFSVIRSLLSGRDLLNLGLTSHCHLDEVDSSLEKEKVFSYFVLKNLLNNAVFNANLNIDRPDYSKLLLGVENKKILVWDITKLVNKRKREIGSLGVWKCLIVETSRLDQNQRSFEVILSSKSHETKDLELVYIATSNMLNKSLSTGFSSGYLAKDDTKGILAYVGMSVSLRNKADMDSLVEFLDDHASKKFEFSADRFDEI